MRKVIKLSASISLFALSTMGFASAVQAQEVGRVISTTPVIQQVAVPRQICTNEQVVVQGQKSGAGGLMGAIAGGAIGNNVGGGAGRGIATVIGVLGGAAMGDRIEGAPAPVAQTVQNCRTQTFYENRTASYNVVYEYAGKQYHVQMPNDPGQFVQLQVTPIGASQAAPVIPAPVIQSIPVVTAPVVQQIVAAPQVVYAQPQVVYARPYYPVIYPAVSIGFGYGWRGGHSRGHGYRNWH
jgi:uncharacterized protein YcfJ